ncbi:MAG: glycosyltransferase family 1 protein [Rhizobiaceae bacterium]|nr:glycosyltransferase family 1 protein [Rhizobiaceae bacterium]
MKVKILTFGTRGDVEPYLALAQGLQRAGHEVTIAAPGPYADWIRSHGVGAFPLRIDIAAFLGRQDVSGPGHTRNPFRQYRSVATGLSQQNAIALEDFLVACEDAEFILQTGDAHGGVEIADRLGIPMAFAFPFPYAPTRAFPSFLARSRLSLGGAYNHWTQRFLLRAGWRVYGPPLNRWRAAHFGLPPLASCLDMLASRRNFAAPTLYEYSPCAVPKPADWLETDHVTGYWFAQPPADWAPDPRIVAFLAAGPPPVYFGFGSMPVRNPGKLTDAVIEALRRTGKRGILLGGSGRALLDKPAGPDVLFVEGVPHGWLFPRMAAVVHHGGAGTTGAVMRAGVPGVVTPLTFDQFSWADLVSRLGIGLRGPFLEGATAAKLIPAILKATSDPELRGRAAAFGETIRAEDGIGNAVRIIEDYADAFAAMRRGKAL